MTRPPVHVGCGEPEGAAPDGKPRRPQVLSLNRQQPFDYLTDAAGRRSDQSLSRQPTVVPFALRGLGGQCWGHDRDPNQSR